jgi:hypothetical protein
VLKVRFVQGSLQILKMTNNNSIRVKPEPAQRIRKFFLPRPLVLDAMQAKENCFSRSVMPSLSWQTESRSATETYCRFLRWRFWLSWQVAGTKRPGNGREVARFFGGPDTKRPVPSRSQGCAGFAATRFPPALPARVAIVRQRRCVGGHREKLSKTCLLTPSAKFSRMGRQ